MIMLMKAIMLITREGSVELENDSRDDTHTSLHVANKEVETGEQEEPTITNDATE